MNCVTALLVDVSVQSGGLVALCVFQRRDDLREGLFEDFLLAFENFVIHPNRDHAILPSRSLQDRGGMVQKGILEWPGLQGAMRLVKCRRVDPRPCTGMG